ncbi:hypothetical protein C5167_021762 [Papaver somniferum]|uniref:Chromo domain-containing protein n=1 Tax=Papaver somniferum TaxID=3469 RepID=A0A4Y7JK13_PAPSO|nr:hypothetical protein C5167_021762 [Papaver somniferum]
MLLWVEGRTEWLPLSSIPELFTGISALTEQQERLKLIHDKLKEGINQHIQDCKNT